MSLTERTRFYLSEWINILLIAVPLRSQASFVELLCGCMVSPEGWVTRAISAIDSKKHWTTYYKLLERGSLRTVRLARALLRLVIAVLPCDMLTLVLDDTLVMRCSEKAPDVAWRREHSGKTNRPRNVWAQCIVTLAVSVLGSSGIGMALPIVSRLVPQRGNTNKLKIALALVRAISGVTDKPAVRLVVHARTPGLAAVAPEHACNWPGSYRYRLVPVARDPQEAPAWPAAYLWRATEQGSQRSAAGYRIEPTGLRQGATRSLALDYCRGPLPQGQANACRLVSVLRRKATVLDEGTIDAGLRNRTGRSNGRAAVRATLGDRTAVPQPQTLVWLQQSLAADAVLELWMQIRSCAWTLTQLLSLAIADAFPMDTIAPWRVGQPVTAGLVAQWLRREFTGFALGLAELAKCWKFRRPEPRQAPAATG